MLLSLKKKRIKTVSFEKIRHNNLCFYNQEGYGGQPIENWPVFEFIKLYLQGDKEKAIENFEKWYEEQLKKYSYVSKNKGGMYKGSLYNLIENRTGLPFEKVDDKIIKEIIKSRVEERFKLLEDIKRFGYNSGVDIIEAVEDKGLVYLQGGHHRAAILRALGYHEIPEILVFSNRFLYKLFCLLRSIKNVNFQK